MAIATTDTQHSMDRLPPQNVEAEAAVIGSLLMDPAALDRVRGELAPDDFYRDRNRTIFEAALAVARQREPVDYLTVTAELRRRGAYEEIGGGAYLMDLVAVVPTALHIEHYAGLVRAAALRRRLIVAAGRIARAGYDETWEMDDVLTYTMEQVAAVQSGVGGIDLWTPEQQVTILADMVAELGKGRPPGLISYFPRLTKLTGGYRRGCLYVVGAPTGVGKTSLMATEARWLRRRGCRVLFASSEMSVQELVKRNAAAVLRRDWNEVERELSQGKEFPATVAAVGDAMGEVGEVAPHVYHAGSMTTEKIRRRALKMQAEGGLDILFVDYLQRLADADPRAKNREQQVSEIAKSLKSIAGDLNVPVVVAAQFSRACQYRPNKEPLISDFRESGGIENEADVAMGLYRASKWDDGADKTEAWLYVLKNRHGAEDKRFRLIWRAEVTEYGEYQPQQQGEVPF